MNAFLSSPKYKTPMLFAPSSRLFDTEPRAFPHLHLTLQNLPHPLTSSNSASLFRIHHTAEAVNKLGYYSFAEPGAAKRLHATLELSGTKRLAELQSLFEDCKTKVSAMTCSLNAVVSLPVLQLMVIRGGHSFFHSFGSVGIVSTIHSLPREWDLTSCAKLNAFKPI